MCRTYFLNFAIANTTDLSEFAVFPYYRALGSVAQKCMPWEFWIVKRESEFCEFFHLLKFNDENCLYPKLLSPRQMFCDLFSWQRFCTYQMLKRQTKQILLLNYFRYSCQLTEIVWQSDQKSCKIYRANLNC